MPVWVCALVLACAFTPARRAEKALHLVQELNRHLLKEHQAAYERFRARKDFEALRASFGPVIFDTGSPFGEEFHANLELMTAHVLASVQAEAPDGLFVGKAATRVRAMGRWWKSMRTLMVERRLKIAEGMAEKTFWSEGKPRQTVENALAVLDEIIVLVKDFEGTVEAYARKIDTLNASIGY
jgi:hypothetical protein